MCRWVSGKVAIHTYSTGCVAWSLENDPGPLPIKAILGPAALRTASDNSPAVDLGHVDAARGAGFRSSGSEEGNHVGAQWTKNLPIAALAASEWP
jgi:hypothetical protein